MTEVHKERKEAEDQIAIQALRDPRDPRENWVTQAPPAPLPTPPILL